MRSLIKYFINNSIAANLLMFAILILGVFGASNIKRLFFPEVPEKIILIQSIYPGASPEEVEEGVVSKVEEAVKGISGVDRVTSKSVENAATVTIEIVENEDVDAILADVKNAVDAIAAFPVGMESIRVYKLEILVNAISYSISGDLNLKALKKYARDIEDDLLAIDGISKVALQGFPEEEIEIAFRENDLRTYQLTLAQATQAIRSANLNITSGTIEGEKEDLLLRANNKGYTANEFRDIIVKTSPGGSITRLHQVANIRDKWVDKPTRAYVDGEAAVIVQLQYTQDVRRFRSHKNTAAIINGKWLNGLLSGGLTIGYVSELAISILGGYCHSNFLCRHVYLYFFSRSKYQCGNVFWDDYGFGYFSR